MLRNKIFVTSQPNSSTLQFVKDIFKVSKNVTFPQSLVDDRLKETNGDLVGVCIPYDIDTKYYTAKVDFWLDEIDSTSEKETIKAYCENNEEISKVIDAFVFLFDKNKPETFQTVKSWLPFLEHAEPGIRMCVGTHSDTLPSMEFDSEVNDWCISNGFDYVDMDETTDTPMDKVGAELALDIIQTNFWDGMIKKKVNGQTEEEDLIREIQELSLQQQKDLLRTAADKDDDDDSLDLPSHSEILEMQEELFGGLDDDDGLDKAFSAIQAMREQGKDMSDEERRKMAAKVALSFAAQLGL